MKSRSENEAKNERDSIGRSLRERVCVPGSLEGATETMMCALSARIGFSIISNTIKISLWF